jgi:two-component system chemotaxis response regulator CheB
MGAGSGADQPNAVKVLIVDDSVFMRQILRDSLQSDPAIEVVGDAADGLEALQRIAELHPDVVTLDLVMPNLNGLETLERIVQKAQPPAVVMVSAYTREDTDITLNCLTIGAVDFVLKPSGSSATELGNLGMQLRTKVKIAAKASPHAAPASPSPAPPTTARPAHPQAPAVAVIGSSTGGPVALEQLLPQLPQDLPYPVLVAQHLPAQFVESLAARLTKTCRLAVEVAQDGDLIRPGSIYFAPGAADTQVIRAHDGRIIFSVNPTDAILTPSVTKLMTSAAQIYGAATLGVILTGMGEDGLEGMQAIKAAGGTTLVQDEATSVVFGMGKAVIEHGWADTVLPLGQIAGKIR